MSNNIEKALSNEELQKRLEYAHALILEYGQEGYGNMFAAYEADMNALQAYAQVGLLTGYNKAKETDNIDDFIAGVHALMLATQTAFLLGRESAKREHDVDG